MEKNEHYNPLPDDVRHSGRPKRRVLRWGLLLSAAALLSYLGKLPIHSQTAQKSPADEWKDDVWPIREQTPWDISKDFPYPRVLEYDVQEGTWLRLDVHPVTGDIVFGMVGDVYCIAADDAYTASGAVAVAHPVLTGVPYDSDPHFSPEGDRIVFRSDAGLGLDNIWVTAWKGCTQMNAETARDSAQRVTNETYRFVSDARFHPSGDKVVATKWFTSSRSIGAGEGWEFPVPALGSNTPVSAGAGIRLLERTLPAGFDDYGEEQIGPEQALWHGDDSLIFSKNIRDSVSFEYSKDVHNGVYSIFERNLTTQQTVTLVDAFPGGASRPELSRDGRTLAFVRRIRDHEILVFKDLVTGTIHYIWDGLSYDVSVIYAPMGTYPSFAFSPDDSAVIIWAAGQIWSVPLSENEFGEKVSGGTPKPIKFIAHIKKYLGKLRTIDDIDLVGIETADTQRVRAFKDLRADATGKRVVFQAAGETFIQAVGDKSPTKVPVLYQDSPYYSPSIVDDEHSTVVVHARWDDQNFTAFELSNIEEGKATEIVGLPRGRYLYPIIRRVDRKHRVIAFVKIASDYLTGDVVATAAPGLYLADIATDGKAITNVRLVPSEISLEDKINMRFLGSPSQLLVQQSDRAFIIDLAGKVDDDGKPPHRTIASGKMSQEIAVSVGSQSSWMAKARKLLGFNQYSAERVAFVDFFHVYLVDGSKLKEDEAVWSKPGNASDGLARLSLDGGHSVTWSDDGKKVFWFLGPYLHSLEVSRLRKCSSTIKSDRDTFGIDCTKTILEYQEIIVEHSTDIARLKEDAALTSDVVVLVNATLLTMETGDLDRDLISDAVMVIRGGVIDSVSAFGAVALPPGATVIDVQGAFITPGFIDMHAHWNAFGNPIPAKSWEMQTFLSYGVTTLHNPSSDNVEGYIERSRVERGHFIGPRIFHTGDVIYGAAAPGIHQDVATMDEAHSALIRLKAEGGPISTSYKNYQLPIRASRQRMLLAAQNLSMLCVPEGGMSFDWDLTYILDGMTTVEHSIPIPVLYDDVLMLYAMSGTGSSPTHLVNYGGAFGEQMIWQKADVPNVEKLRRFSRHDILEGLTESTARPDSSYQFFNTSASIAKMVDMGLKTFIGAHGEPPLGLNYHYEMSFAQAGGLSNYQVYQAATSHAAQTLGLFSSLGSLSAGKLADFVVFEAGADVLGARMPESLKIVYVARGGRIWEADTMTELWPVKGRKQAMPPFNP
ncbi:hypothetical protein BDZ89DRAFT_1167612 [Hymenopellis radicata]|nr:hypothetical protein BDZ89DRAFT_1167612 [Hymenopellis radicata]